MRLFLVPLLLVMATSLYLFSEDMKTDRQRDLDIAALQTQIDALQLVASGQIQVPEYDGTKVIRPKVIKY